MVFLLKAQEKFSLWMIVPLKTWLYTIWLYMKPLNESLFKRHTTWTYINSLIPHMLLKKKDQLVPFHQNDYLVSALRAG